MSDNEYEADRDLENIQQEETTVPDEEEEEDKEEEEGSSSGRAGSSSMPSLRGAPEHEREDIMRRQNAEVRLQLLPS